MEIFKVDDSWVNARIDKFLVEHLGESRNKIQNLLKKEAVLVNEKVAKKNYILKLEDNITFKEVVEEEKEVLPLAVFVPEIITETPDYFIVNKPSGMAVHPDTKNKGNTLSEWLCNHDEALKNIGEDTNRPGIVHRLDQGVSGVMVVARTNEFFKHMKQQFAERLSG